MMRWAQLPRAGGLGDQDPDLLDGFRYIFNEREKMKAEEHSRQEREMKSKGRSRGKRR